MFSFIDIFFLGGFNYTMIPQESYPEDYRNEMNGRDVGIFIVKRIKQKV